MKKIANFLKKIFKRKSPEVKTYLSYEHKPVQPLSDPYIIQIKNNNKVKHKIDLFGFNWNFEKLNFGLPKGIEIINLQSESLSYGAIVSQLASNPVKIGKWRFQSMNSKNLQKTIIIWDRDANGEEHKYPLNLGVMLDAYQFQSNVLDVTKVVGIDGNITIITEIEPLSSVVISIYPIQKVINPLRREHPTLEFLSDRIEGYDTPRLSGNNMAPIIIQSLNYPTVSAKLKNVTRWQKITKFLFGWMWKEEKMKLQSAGLEESELKGAKAGDLLQKDYPEGK